MTSQSKEEFEPGLITAVLKNLSGISGITGEI